jgi:hypothetical protein
MWMMHLNGAFVVLNMFFMMVLDHPTVNALAALICLAGFGCAYYNWLHHDEDDK